jgi:hypothetical protein
MIVPLIPPLVVTLSPVLSLPALLGQNQHEIEDGENEHHHQYAEPRTASLLKE